MSRAKYGTDWATAAQTLHDQRSDLVTMLEPLLAGLVQHRPDQAASMRRQLDGVTRELADLEVSVRLARLRMGGIR